MRRVSLVTVCGLLLLSILVQVSASHAATAMPGPASGAAAMPAPLSRTATVPLIFPATATFVFPAELVGGATTVVDLGPNGGEPSLGERTHDMFVVTVRGVPVMSYEISTFASEALARRNNAQMRRYFRYTTTVPLQANVPGQWALLLRAHGEAARGAEVLTGLSVRNLVIVAAVLMSPPDRKASARAARQSAVERVLALADLLASRARDYVTPPVVALPKSPASPYAARDTAMSQLANQVEAVLQPCRSNFWIAAYVFRTLVFGGYDADTILEAGPFAQRNAIDTVLAVVRRATVPCVVALNAFIQGRTRGHIGLPTILRRYATVRAFVREAYRAAGYFFVALDQLEYDAQSLQWGDGFKVREAIRNVARTVAQDRHAMALLRQIEHDWRLA